MSFAQHLQDQQEVCQHDFISVFDTRRCCKLPNHFKLPCSMLLQECLNEITVNYATHVLLELLDSKEVLS
jgi:hypothetical protein